MCSISLEPPSWRPPPREELISRLESEEYDVLVIGGGATGSGVALDAATRGLRVAMVEKNDFASGTSSRSTKLIHGGLRYLAQAFQKKIPPRSLLDVIANFHFKPEYLKIVAADLSERSNMLASAPFMATPLPMLVPLYRWWEVPLFAIVGFLYDAIAGQRRAVPPSRVVSADEARFTFPALRTEDAEGNALIGALCIHDGQQNDARMCIHIALTAIEAGATCANYCEVEGLLHDEGFSQGAPGARLCGATVRDRVSGREIKVRAKQVVNACGVFSDAVREMAQPGCRPIMTPSYGTHLVLPEYDSARGTGLVWFTEDGRVLYLLPWEGSTVAGTTDRPGDISFEPKATKEEVDFILGECNRLVQDGLGPSDVRAAWAGVRPLVADPNAAPGDTKALSREHVVEALPCGLVTVAGGKWTTYRKMAEDAVDACIAGRAELGARAAPCRTQGLLLVGCDREGAMCGGQYDRITAALRTDYGLDRDVARHLRYNYGVYALQVVELARLEPARFASPDGGFQRLHPQYAPLAAEVAFACRNEFAETAVDVLAHRTRLAFLNSAAALEVLPRVLAIMQKEKGWDDARVASEHERAGAFLRAVMKPPGAPEDDAGAAAAAATSGSAERDAVAV